jgi:hypothetical protein
MLKRLLIAVFVLGLILALNGTAISDVQKGELTPLIKTNPNAPMFNVKLDARPNQPTFKKPESALRNIPPGQPLPSPPQKQSYFCADQDYTSGVATLGWTNPDAYGDDLFNMRFTADADYDCTLKVAKYLMYGGVYVSGEHGMTGDPDMRCYLWDDDGFGFPNNKLDSVDIPWATIQAAFTSQGNLFWLTADFSAGNWVFSDGDEYHYGWKTLQNTPDDTLSIISDAADGPYAGEERSSEYFGGLWGTMLNDWGLDVSFFILSNRCCSEQPFSDCYYQTYWQNIGYYWPEPFPTYNVRYFSQRFSVAGPETLMNVDVYIYDPGDGSFGNDSVFMTVYDSDTSAVYPGTVIARVGFGPGEYPAFPSPTTFDFSALNLVFYNDFHLGFSSNAVLNVDYESCLSSDGTDGTGRSTCFYSGSWRTVLSLFGDDVNFLFDAWMCRDEYSHCSWNWCYNVPNYVWFLPDPYGDYAHAQKFSALGFQECRVQDVCWYLYDAGVTYGYTHQSKVSVYTDAGGLPGTELASILIGPGTGIDYNFYPAPTCVDFEPLNVYVTGKYWVAIDAMTLDPDSGIVTVSDAGGGGCVDGLAENYMGAWELLWPYWSPRAMPQDIADVVEVFHCCAPYTGRSCGPGGEDWATYQHDYARTGASFTALSDAWCDLTVDWSYTDPTQVISFAGPIIAFNRVICSFTSKYLVFDLAGNLLYTLSGGPIGTTNIRSTPTVAQIPGYPDPLLFVAGGSTNKVAAYNLNTGGLVWQTANLGALTRYSRLTVLDMGGGTTGVFFPLENGKVYGVDALTGLTLAGYPVTLPLPILVANATDGQQLFFNTYSSSVNGDIYAIQAATGAINWSFVAANPAQGLMGDDLWPVALPESFYAGISYDAVINAVYTCSRQNGVTSGTQYPADGILYSADATTGVMNWATLANRAYYQTPIIDANAIYMPNFSTWVGPVGGPAGGYLFSADKFTGAIVNTYNAPPGGLRNADGTTRGYRRYYADGLLTCEPDNSDYPEDLIFVFSEEGYFSCVQSVSFNEIYRRRIDHLNPLNSATDIGLAGAIGTDEDNAVHLVFADYWGELFDMIKKDDRPRLEIQTYNPILAVEFGPAAHLIDSIPGVLTNTGCANLNFENVQVDENTFGQTIPFFSTKDPDESDFLDRAAKIADKLQREAYLSKYLRTADGDADNILSVREMALGKETMNRAAAGFPPFLNSVLHPTAGDFINPGDTMGIVMDIIQTAINRGPQVFYMLMDTDDPDFFLNDTARGVEICVTLVGGCLIDTTSLFFGVGQANQQIVTNTGRIGTGDWAPHAFNIDGDNASYYQGAYVYGVSTYRIATNTQDWLSGGGEADAFISLQADPNWCDNSCKPYLNVGVSLGLWTTDGGLTYQTIIGDMVCKSFLDSVQNFGGDWSNFGAPFDNDSTMGLYVNGRVVGAYELSPSGDPIPELANVTLEILEFTERNGDSVPNWYFGEIYDCDNGGDSVGIDRSISTAWTYNRPAKDQAWGHIKIPFGCNYAPIINTWGTYGASGTPGHGFWGWNIWWDQCYNDMAAGVGPHGGMFIDGDMSSGDQEAMVTFAKKDFGPNDTMSIGIAHFGLHNLTDASSSAEIAPLAKLVNKWAGFGRGDVNNDGLVNLADIVYLCATANGGPGAVPFRHLGDVNGDGNINGADVDYLINWYFWCGPCPVGHWIF